MVQELASLKTSDARAHDLWRQAAEKRLKFQRRCEGDPDFQAKVIEKCRRDVAFFIDHFAWTYDPRNPGKDVPGYVPFELYERQRELLIEIGLWRRDKLNASILKCRGVGASWVLIAYSVWAGLFQKGFKATFGSRTEKSLDVLGDPDSLFEKARILMARLPKWFMAVVAPGFKRDDHSKKLAIVFPDTGSSITGEIGKNMGVGGRASIYVWDEAAKSDNPLERLRGILNNTEVLIEISTPNGLDNPFAQRIKQGVTRLFEMPWDCVPWRDAHWLERMRQESAHDPRGFAQEVMMDFLGSAEGSVIPPAWVKAAVGFKVSGGAHISAGFDVGLTGDSNVLYPRCGPLVFEGESWHGLLPEESAERILQRCGEEGASCLSYDVLGVGEALRVALGDLPPHQLALHDLPAHFKAQGIKFSAKATRRRWPDGRRSHELFVNLRAELYWNVRERFRKTYENVTRGAGYPLEECISIPNDPKLIDQLSWLKEKRSTAGLIQVERKDEMKRRRGSSQSPDHADALVYAFADDVIAPRRTAHIGWT